MARSLGLALLFAALSVTSAGAATLTPIGSFDKPIFITSDPADPDRLFVVEQDGRVSEVLDGGSPELYAEMTDLVACCGERGLLSIALPPDFDESGLFYGAYTGETTAGGALGDIHVDGFVADENARVTRTPIISIPHSQAANHNGGQLQFGPDGYLYISTGDGGGGGDPFETGQDLSALLGKILRIDPKPGSTPAYAIPPGNPFAGQTAGADEIWAYGLRNPWRFSFDRLTGDMLIADVGQGAREEVDLAVSPSAGVVGGAGANYGWSCREGFLAYTDATPSANCAGVSGFAEPIFDYPHADPGGGAAYGCSITGGYVVRDPSLGDLHGRYLYADYCIGQIRSLGLPAGTAPATDDRAEGIALPQFSVTSFGEDSCGRVYVLSGNNVSRFLGDAPPDCPKPPEEEPPGEEKPPTVEAPAAQPPGGPLLSCPRSTDCGPLRVRRRPAFRLTSERLPRRLVVSVRVGPCAGWTGKELQLNRGGRPVGRKRIDRDCESTFRLPLPEMATFRALLETDEGRVYRSQVLKIALAKPTP
jgi:glucose/arabinose dehydrogenase